MGKRAIVTGGSKGVARVLLQEGASVVISGRDAVPAETAAAFQFTLHHQNAGTKQLRITGQPGLQVERPVGDPASLDEVAET